MSALLELDGKWIEDRALRNVDDLLIGIDVRGAPETERVLRGVDVERPRPTARGAVTALPFVVDVDVARLREQHFDVAHPAPLGACGALGNFRLLCARAKSLPTASGAPT